MWNLRYASYRTCVRCAVYTVRVRLTAVARPGGGRAFAHVDRKSESHKRHFAGNEPSALGFIETVLDESQEAYHYGLSAGPSPFTSWGVRRRIPARLEMAPRVEILSRCRLGAR